MQRGRIEKSSDKKHPIRQTVEGNATDLKDNDRKKIFVKKKGGSLGDREREDHRNFSVIRSLKGT